MHCRPMRKRRVKFLRDAGVYNPATFTHACCRVGISIFTALAIPFMRSLFLIVLFSGLFIASCKKEQGTATVTGYSEYYPLAPGRSVSYAVDSTVWDDFDCSVRRDTVWMRYTVADSFMDAEGRVSYPINVDQREADTLPWSPLRTIYATATGQRLEVVDGNLRFIKLVFPVVEGATWNGNAQINTAEQELQYFDGWAYNYAAVGQSFNTGYKTYSNTVSVPAIDESQNDPDDPALVEAYAYRTVSKEVYAKDAGLVFRELTRWIYDPGVKKCRRGFSITMRAVENN